MTVRFVTDGGTELADIIVKFGDLIERPADPEKKGYTFFGWYKDAECTKLWDFETETLEEDTTLYAKWTENPVSPIMRSVLMGSEYPVMDTPHFLCSKLGNGFIAEQAPLLDAKELDPVLCKQVDVPLCHAPLAAYAVNALDQHQIHLTSEDGLCDLLERRAV